MILLVMGLFLVLDECCFGLGLGRELGLLVFCRVLRFGRVVLLAGNSEMCCCCLVSCDRKSEPREF